MLGKRGVTLNPPSQEGKGNLFSKS